MSIQIIPAVSEEDVSEIARLAENIWMEHYLPILSVEQIVYMVKKFQSKEAIASQIASGYSYYLIMWEDSAAGYFAIRRDPSKLFLSKLYVDERFRHRRIASRVIAFLEKLCRVEKLETIWLTVNKNNKSSIAAYLRMGFSTVRSQTEPIGEGFVMDDFVMEHKVPEE